MGDFSEGGVHETDGFWWVIFQRGAGEYTKPMGFDGFRNVFMASKIKRPGRLFRQILNGKTTRRMLGGFSVPTFKS